MSTITITGNTYPVKEQLKAMGARWNADAKGWDVPTDRADEARRIVQSGPSRVTPRMAMALPYAAKKRYFKKMNRSSRCNCINCRTGSESLCQY